jgi:DNA gyrase/topoisomerase IV subunit A
MSEQSYEFDPCSIDGSDKEEVTLDSWKPKAKIEGMPLSQWRQDQIGSNFNQQPGIDELNKIHAFIKQRKSDSDIMKAFGITAETLIAIKKDKYDPVEGISLDNQSKIYKEFKRLEERIDSLLRGINHIAECMFTTKADKAAYKKSLKKPKKEKVSKVKKNEKIGEDFIGLDEDLDKKDEEE